MEDGILLSPDLHFKAANGTCIDKLSSAVLEALAVSTPKSLPHDNPRPPKSVRITNTHEGSAKGTVANE